MRKSPDVAPIHKAVMRNSLAQVTAALASGEDVDALDREGRTALFYAAQDGDLMIAAELIGHGANVSTQDKALKTPLHAAASSYQPAVAELLLINGAKVDAKDIYGNTPLSDAVFDSRGRGEMIELLLAHGADKFLKNNQGVSPHDLARNVANYEITPFLE